MQKYHVVCYKSRKLKEHENNYATHDVELTSIVHALKVLMHYLIGRKFELRIEPVVRSIYWRNQHQILSKLDG